MYRENQKRRERGMKGFVLFLTILFSAVLTGMLLCRAQSERISRAQQKLSEEVLRFHVLANSDSEEDQRLKLRVRDAVLDYLEEEMPQDAGIAGTVNWTKEHTDELEQVCRQELSSQGADQSVSAAVTTCYFPDRTYGEVTFPAGNYRALRIELGEAKGHNWWCVLYPNLCFLDSVNAVVPPSGRQKLKNVLTEEEYSGISATSEFRIRWFFDFLR